MVAQGTATHVTTGLFRPGFMCFVNEGSNGDFWFWNLAHDCFLLIFYPGLINRGIFLITFSTKVVQL
jgi:hypothetical protein